MVSQTTSLCAAKLSSVSTAVFDHIDGGLGDEILVVGIDVSIVVGVSIVVVQCGDDGHAPPYRQHMEQHEHGADGENHVGDGPWFRN